MEDNKLDYVPDPYTKATYELLTRVLIPGCSQGNAFPIPNGSNVTYIVTSNIDNVVIGESKAKIKSMDCVEQLKQEPVVLLDALECMPKPLLSFNDFSTYIFDPSKADPVKCFFRKELEGKQPEEVAAIIYCGVLSGLLRDTPTYRAVMHEYGQIIKKMEYLDLMREGFDEEETVPYLERFRKKREELMHIEASKEVATVQPLPWQRLFTAIPGIMDMHLVTEKLKMVYKEFNTIYFDCTDEAFLACFGLPEGSQPTPIVWLSSGRVLNYFMKCLFAGRMKGWDTAGALFVQQDGSPYNNLATQIIDDTDEKLTIDAIFEKILKEKSS